jgi:KaiC/GvpD/RAD55 family RecA-like ATPase
MKQNEWLTLKTGISQAYWCKLEGQDRATFDLAELEEDGYEKPICWFDEMFYGAIRFPLVSQRPATCLLMGPPGSGKSTLALELCYRLADISFTDGKPIGNKTKPWLSLYISSDMDAIQVFEKANSFGWQRVEDRFFTGKGEIPSSFGTHGMVVVRGADSLREGAGMAEAVRKVLKEGIDLLEFIPEDTVQSTAKIGKLAEKLTKWMPTKDPIKKTFKQILPDVVVIDSLNTLELNDRRNYFEQFLNAASGKTHVVVFILDSHHPSIKKDFWEYMCDFVVTTGYDTTKGYFLRDIEIVKARYQDHVLGKQQMKIYSYKCESCGFKDNPTCEFDFSKCKLDPKNMRREHPYRHEGGIFIYPSIHYYLSKYKRRGPDVEPTYVDTLPKPLNQIVQYVDEEQVGIFPEGRCTAFVGRRGGHKSHLGYLHLLHRLITHEESALVVSLRDDEEMTKRAMYNILRQEFSKENPRSTINEYELLDRLEILYYPPGYITPEEFFHRMFMSVYRLKRIAKDKKLTVLFNSVDQLAARFPLCAAEDIFIPGIIASLTGENTTSIFIAVDEPGQPEKQYGLIPMADFVLSFSRRRFKLGDYYNHLKYFQIEKAYIKMDDVTKEQVKDTTVVQVQRFAGGEMAGAMGFLELVTHHDTSLYNRDGLHFIPLVPGLSSGEELR